ncbi:hypothetical protein K5L16_29545, partial [Klebsiella pneumoniae]|uniref:hypothetical protein n=2 Tax=Klebsiella pneumoniae TaxID=573 RepID=UPI001E384C97
RGLRGIYTPFPDTKLVSNLSVCFADAPCIDGYYFMFSFTVSSLVTMTSVKESGVVIISCLVLTDTLSHHKNKNWCSLSLEYHYFVAL